MLPLADTTVLTAEDERSVRMLIRVVLESAGATVIEAGDGLQAMRLVQLHPELDVLLTDLNMPEMDGEELIEAVHRGIRPDLPIVVCSAVSMLGYHPVQHSGACATVSKPFAPSELVRAIAAARRSGRMPRTTSA